MLPVSIPGFELLEEIGCGNTWTVFRAQPADSPTQVAIKLLRPELENEVPVVERVRSEAVLGRSLDHAHIVRVLGFGSVFDPKSKPPYWFAEELIRGPTLAQLLAGRRGKPFSEPQACQICIPLCTALDYAHNQRSPVFHRDVKPSNIALTEDGLVKLMDFGGEPPTPEKRSSRPLILPGAAEYLPPECATSGLVEARGDLYSLGVVLYELATGRLPFTRAPRETDLALLEKHAREAPVAPRKLREELSPAIDAIISQLLAKDPNERIQSAGDQRAARSSHQRENARAQPAGRQSRGAALPAGDREATGGAPKAPAEISTKPPKEIARAKTDRRRKTKRRPTGAPWGRRLLRLAAVLVPVCVVAGLGAILFVPRLEQRLPQQLRDRVPAALWEAAKHTQSTIQKWLGGSPDVPPNSPVTTSSFKHPVVQEARHLRDLLGESSGTRLAEQPDTILRKFKALLASPLVGELPTELMGAGSLGDEVLGVLFARALHELEKLEDLRTDLAGPSESGVPPASRTGAAPTDPLELDTIEARTPPPGEGVQPDQSETAPPSTREVLVDSELQAENLRKQNAECFARAREWLDAAYAFHLWRRDAVPDPNRVDELLWNLEDELFVQLAKVIWYDAHLVAVYGRTVRCTPADAEPFDYFVPGFMLGATEISEHTYCRGLSRRSGDDLACNGQPRTPVVNIGYDRAARFAQDLGFSLPTYLMWRIVAFGGTGDGEIELDPKQYVLKGRLSMESVRDGEYRQPVPTKPGASQTDDFFHLFGNAAEWVRLDEASRRFLEDRRAELASQGAESCYYCGFAQGLDPADSSGQDQVDGLSHPQDGKPSSWVGFRCALELAGPIRLPPPSSSPASPGD